MPFVAVDPATGKQTAEVPFASPTQTEQKVASAQAAYLDWRLLSVEERIRPLAEMGRLLRERKDALGALMTSEMGKPIRQATAEAEKLSLIHI